MNFSFDFTWLLNFLYEPDKVIFWKIFLFGGWVPIIWALYQGLLGVWINYRQGIWSKTVKRILLAIDIPRTNLQTPKAVENMFNYLSGLHDSIRPIEKYWEGHFQLSFSLEIISIGGNIQYLIRAPERHRELVETAIYSQYPDAEITEVEDYTNGMPTKFPDDEYDVYGLEFVQGREAVYPIKTYKEFEHQLSDAEIQYKDPLAAFMDFFSSLKEGEQYWYQILISPAGFDWQEEGQKEINKILGAASEDNLGDKFVGKTLKILHDFSEMIYSLWADIEDPKKKEPLKMLELNPIQKKKIEAISEKTSKFGFRTKIRFVYLAKKEVFNRYKAISGMFGFMRQFMDIQLNALIPDTKFTMTRSGHLYFLHKTRLNWKKNNIVQNYINRDSVAGRVRGILSVEELATLWNFPSEVFVKTALIEKVSGKRAGPPASLPTSEELPISRQLENFNENNLEIDFEADLDKPENKNNLPKKGSAPENLPIG